MRPSGTFLPASRGDRARHPLTVANEVIDSGVQGAGWAALWCLGCSVLLWSFACILLAMILTATPGMAAGRNGGAAVQRCVAMPVLTGAGFGACLLAPVFFIMGMVGYYPQQRALLRVSGQLALYMKHFAQYK